MPLKDPFAAYNAAHNVEAELVRNALVAAGIEAHFTEDLMSLGMFAFGPIPELHRPQVWIEPSNRASILGFFADLPLALAA